MGKVYYNEIDPFCCKVLRKQIGKGNLPEGFVDQRDIRDVKPEDLDGYRQCHFFAGIGGFPYGFKLADFPEDIEIWTGGFPCQDISLAGPGGGLSGERSGLYFQLHRLVGERMPDWLLLENVPALRTRGADQVIESLEGLGYSCWATVVGAWAVEAPHRRNRAIVIANRSGVRVEGFATPALQGIVGIQGFQNVRRVEDLRGRPDLPEPIFRGGRDGIPDWVDRLSSLGNAVVPQVVELFARWIARVA